jgi:putative transposase
VTDTNVFQLCQPEAFAVPLTEVLRNGARTLLAHAVEAEVAGFLSVHSDKLTGDGHQRLVRHGYLPEREIMTDIGPVAVRCPRVCDRIGERLSAHSFFVGHRRTPQLERRRAQQSQSSSRSSL